MLARTVALEIPGTVPKNISARTFRHAIEESRDTLLRRTVRGDELIATALLRQIGALLGMLADPHMRSELAQDRPARELLGEIPTRFAGAQGATVEMSASAAEGLSMFERSVESWAAVPPSPTGHPG